MEKGECRDLHIGYLVKTYKSQALAQQRLLNLNNQTKVGKVVYLSYEDGIA